MPDDLSNEPLPSISIVGDLPSPLEQFEDPQHSAEESLARLREMVAARDPVALLAKTGHQFLIEALTSETSAPGASGLEQAEVELLQTVALSLMRGPAVPTSPNNITRIWKTLKSNLVARISVKKSDPKKNESEITLRARIQTAYYRNHFSSEDAKTIIPSIARRMDKIYEDRRGYRLSVLAAAIYKVFDEVGERAWRNQRSLIEILGGHNVEEHIDRIRRESPVARRAWEIAAARVTDDAKQYAAFQLSECACASLFVLDRSFLEDSFGTDISNALFGLALSFGDIDADTLPSAHLDSKVREKPFIRLNDDQLFLPIPSLLVSFPFSIIEALVAGDSELETSYSNARTKFLEDEVAAEVENALPNAVVYRGVWWKDAKTKERFECDTVAVLGNHILVFEAKSGKLSHATRRGGEDSIRKNFKRLFVEATEQANRFTKLVHAGPAACDQLRDKYNKKVHLGLETPTVVLRFGVCIEHLASITSSRRYFDALKLIDKSTRWAPILSIGELKMIARTLDTEVSFFHYLTKRSSLEEMINFVGDEQDILSMYLKGGLNVDPDAYRGLDVVFSMVDGPVRGHRTPRDDRTEFATPGILLPSGWALAGQEIYRSGIRNRFDALETILNQNIEALSDFERRVRRWKRGAGRGANLLSTTFIASGRIYVVSILMKDKPPESEDAWQDEARLIALQARENLHATDCTVILRLKKSKGLSYDALSFFRFSSFSY